MRHIGPILVMLAAVCWGLTGALGGKLMAEGWSPLVLAFYRGSIGFGIVLVWLVTGSKKDGLGDWRLWLWAFVAGLGIAGNFSFYFLSIEAGSVAVAATLMYCAPVFVYLTAFTLKLERPSPLKWGAIIIVMVGVLLLTQIHKVDSADISLFSVGAGLLAGMSYALFIFAFKNAASRGSPQVILVIAFGVLVGVLMWPTDLGQAVTAVHSSRWPLFLILGIVGAGFSFFIYIVGIHATTPTVASVVAMLEPVIAAASGILILRETLSATQFLGMGLILLTATGLSLYTTSKNY